MLSRSKLLYALLCGCTAAALPRRHVSAELLRECGTLITVVPTHDGLVVGSDRRTYDPVHGDRDVLKIRVVRDAVLLAAAGTPTFSTQVKPDDVLYSATDIAAGFLQKYDLRLDVRPRLADLGELLCRRLQAVVPPATLPVDETRIVFQLIVAQCPAETQRLSVLRVTNFGGTAYLSAVEPVRGLELGVPLCYGNVNAIDAMKDDARFVRWRADRSLAKFYAPPLGRQNVSAADAVAFIRAITRASSEILPMIDSSRNHVGPDVDVALLPNRGRLRWLFHDARRKAS